MQKIEKVTISREMARLPGEDAAFYQRRRECDHAAAGTTALTCLAAQAVQRVRAACACGGTWREPQRLWNHPVAERTVT